MRSLPGLYQQLVSAINQDLPYVANVYVTEYPDPTHDAAGGFCDMQPFPDLVGFTANEARWVSQTVVTSLNRAIDDAVA